MDAKYIKGVEGEFPKTNQEVYWAATGQETWPGYASPLGMRGYWVGKDENHECVGETLREVDEFLAWRLS